MDELRWEPPTDASSPSKRRLHFWLPVLLLVALAFFDLLAPPISPTIHRQTQTWVQIRNLASDGFGWDAFSIGITGPEPFRVVYEFPLYHAMGMAAVSFAGDSWLAPKLISLAAAVVALLALRHWMQRHWGRTVAQSAALLMATIPIVVLLATAIQPDMLAMAFAAASLLALDQWRLRLTWGWWATFLMTTLLALLVKFNVLVPFVPLVLARYLWHGSSFRLPRAWEVISALVFVAAPFLAWIHLRGIHTDPSFLQLDARMFLLGDISRFFSPQFYVKPAFILGAMVCAGVGAVLPVIGLRGLDVQGWLLVAGIPFYFLVVPTAADQTYYALPLVPGLSLLMARGWTAATSLLWIRSSGWIHVALGMAWIGGLAIALPYTLRHDEVTWRAARALHDASGDGDFALVLNMHDRGVGIGGFNPAMLVLAQRKGWNISPASVDAAAVATMVEQRRLDGARWLVGTWFTPDLDPWFMHVLPARFSRQPRLRGQSVDGESMLAPLLARYSVAARGSNFVVLKLDA